MKVQGKIVLDKEKSKHNGSKVELSSVSSASIAEAQEKRRLGEAEIMEGGKGQACKASWVVSNDKKFKIYSTLEAIGWVFNILAMHYISSESSTADCTYRHIGI